MSKIITINQVAYIKRGRLKLVLVGGCFDIFHIGHLKFLQTAKKSGDILMVALEPDSKVASLKGKNRPINSQKERAEMLSALDIVNYVILLPDFKSDDMYSELIKKIKPDIIAVTRGDPLTSKKTEQAKTVGGILITIGKVKTPSTTQLTKLLGID